MPLDYVEKIGALTDEKRLHFYELLAHNLTIAVRGIWSDADISDGEKVDRMKWVNEIMHRVTAKTLTYVSKKIRILKMICGELSNTG